MKNTVFPYQIFHLDVLSPAARACAELQAAYAHMTSLTANGKERVEAAKAIQALGGYKLAARVDAETATTAILQTTTLRPGGWHCFGGKAVEPTGLSIRSTSSYDIITRFEKDAFLIMPLGLLSMATGLFTERVE